MSQCPECHREIQFKDILMSFNPARIECGGCRTIIPIRTATATLLVLSASAMMLLYVYVFTHLGLPSGLLIAGVLVIALGLEYVYYLLLKSGRVQSELKFPDSEQVQG